MSADGLLLALGLTADEALAALGDRALRDRIAGLPAAFVVVGIDRVTPPSRPGVARATDSDPSVVAAALVAEGVSPLVIAGAAHDDLPYNLARRALSLDHLSHGNSGLLLGQRDSRGNGETAWKNVGSGAPLGTRTAAEAATAIAELWQSWPRDAVVGDKETGVLVDADRIRRVGRRGVVTVAGPLSVPASVQGAPPLLWYAETPEVAAAAPAVADLVVFGGPAETAAVLAAVEATTTPVFAEVAAGRDDFTGHDVRQARSAGARGVLVRSSGTDDPSARLTRLLDLVPNLSAAEGLSSGATAPTLRARLALPDPEPLLRDAPSAFPAPTPDVYR